MDRRNFLSLLTAGVGMMLVACQETTPAPADSEEASTTEAEPELAETEATTASRTSLEPVTMRLAALKGPTAMGLVKLMSDVDAGEVHEDDYHFEIVASPDEVTPKIAQAEVDLAALPANLASVLYNKTQGGVRVVAINTLGVLYICEKGETLSSVSDLAGRTIYASGKGATPEYALNYLLEKNGLIPDQDVTVEWKSEHAECVAALAADPEGTALLPQPFVTTAQMQDDTIRVAIDLTKEWDAVSEDGSSLITGVLVARSAFLDEHADVVAQRFLPRYAASVDFANENVAQAASLVGSYDIVPEPVAAKALPACNIVCITGDELRERLGGYLEALYAQNPEAVGGELPKDDFYFSF